MRLGGREESGGRAGVRVARAAAGSPQPRPPARAPLRRAPLSAGAIRATPPHYHIFAEIGSLLYIFD